MTTVTLCDTALGTALDPGAVSERAARACARTYAREDTAPNRTSRSVVAWRSPGTATGPDRIHDSHPPRPEGPTA